jgi:uncharacterized protein YcbX
MQGILSQIIIYPIKSAAGITLPKATVTKRGLAFDRHWMVVEDNGKFLTQREHPKMALIKPSLDEDRLVVRATGMPVLEIPFEARGQQSLTVQVWNDTCEATTISDTVDEWFCDFFERLCHLVFMPPSTERRVDPHYSWESDRISFADGFPFLLISEASLADLNKKLSTPLPMNRFRPNLVVSGTKPYAEDSWKEISIGTMHFRVVKPCARCSITTVDQEKGVHGQEPLRTLATYRRKGAKVMFGQNVIHNSVGQLEVGSEVHLINY